MSIENNFETFIFKSLLTDGKYFGKVFSSLKSDYFTNIGHKKLYDCIKEYFKDYHDKPSLTELVAKVKDIPNAEVRKSVAEVIKEIHDLPNSELKNTDFMLDETLKFIKQSLYFKALEIGAEGLQKRSEELQQKAQRILDERAKVSFDDSIGLDFDDLSDMLAYFSERNLGIRTSLKTLNKRLGTGFLPGTLNVIAAAQGVGKSLLMCHLATDFLQQGKNILMVSLEMSDKEMMKRIYANTLDIDVNAFSDLSRTDYEKEKIQEEQAREIVTKEQIQNAYNAKKASGKLGKFYVKDYPSGAFSALMLEELVRKYKTELNVEFDMIFVDYLGIMKSDLISPSAGLYSYLKSIGEELRATAKKLALPIISASQLNRAAINKTDNVDGSMMSDSIGTNMTADFIMLILQNETLKANSEVACKITKNRYNGMTDTFMLNVDYPKMRFLDMVIPNQPDNATQDASDAFKSSKPEGYQNEDFGLVTSQKQKTAEEFTKEVATNLEHVPDTHGTANPSASPFNDVDIFAELGL